MITLWKQNGKGLVRTAILESGCWIHVTTPTPIELETLTREYGIQPDVIADILDIDERSRTEREEGYTLFIVRVPVYEEGREVPYYTVPLGIIERPDIIITICMRENPVVDDLLENRVRNLELFNKRTFLLHVLMRSAYYYLRYLKEINRHTTKIERELQKSVKNNELIRLLELEKSLVFFTTSLKSNELLMMKLGKTGFGSLTELEADLLEDVLTENKQAIEMANIYSNILSGLMDAFASVISNNLNVVMKRLTSISILLMIPTLFASFYGMNVHLPLQNSPLAFLGLVMGSIVVSTTAALLFMRKKLF